MNHAERYEYLTTKLSSMRWRGGELDCSYQAALYLMASHPALAEKVERYFSPDGIDFGGLMKKEEFDYDWMKLTADAAHNLFSWNSKCAATPFEISRMPAPAIQAIYTSLRNTPLATAMGRPDISSILPNIWPPRKMGNRASTMLATPPI